jgi:putative sugar O-methyltransferase
VTRWDVLTRRTLDEVERCDPAYRPTTFWGPGIRTILDDIGTRSLNTFKSWPSAQTWFYPAYGNGFAPSAIEATFEAARRVNDQVQRAWFRAALSGAQHARRDFDAARLAWDQVRWPFDLEGLGESEAGAPPQAFRLSARSDAMWSRPYLNYLLCLAGLSRHLDAVPHRFLEIGGGYGVLGEIVLSRDPDAVYVDLDLPPLLTVASSYLDLLFADRVTTYEGLPEVGPLDLPGSACLPNWRIGDLRGPFDVFVNSFSFQEMEPEVVERYAGDVTALAVEWVVSLNSRSGKAVQDEENPIGVRTPVTSASIVGAFEARGYRVVATYGDPLIQHNVELAILRRDRGAADASNGGRRAAEAPGRFGQPWSAMPATVDLRRPVVSSPRQARKAARQASRIHGRSRGGVGRWMARALRAVRRRLR